MLLTATFCPGCAQFGGRRTETMIDLDMLVHRHDPHNTAHVARHRQRNFPARHLRLTSVRRQAKACARQAALVLPHLGIGGVLALAPVTRLLAPRSCSRHALVAASQKTKCVFSFLLESNKCSKVQGPALNFCKSSCSQFTAEKNAVTP